MVVRRVPVRQRSDFGIFEIWPNQVMGIWRLHGQDTPKLTNLDSQFSLDGTNAFRLRCSCYCDELLFPSIRPPLGIVSSSPALGRVAVILKVWRQIMSANSLLLEATFLANFTRSNHGPVSGQGNGGHIEASKLGRTRTRAGCVTTTKCHNTGGPVTIPNPPVTPSCISLK